MAFEKELAVQPASIADISVELFSPAPASTEQASAIGRIQVKMADGSIRIRTVDLGQHLPVATINQLQTLMATIRTKANAEILAVA